MKIDIVIPVYRPTEKLQKLLERLEKQSCPPEKIFLLHTDDGKSLTFFERENKIPIVEVKIQTSEFDHGKTRDLGMRLADTDFVVMMTQDAVPADRFLLEELAFSLEKDSTLAAVYARQIPDEQSNILERYTRKFNYPSRSCIKSEEDLETLGVKTYFFSNVCAAYRQKAYLEIGGFEQHIIFNEDMVFAASAIRKGWRIGYNAKAKVVHSHQYSYGQLFRRYFDQGVSQSNHPEVFGEVRSEREGIRLIRFLSGRFLRQRNYAQFIWLALESVCKYMGYQFGKHYQRLPKRMILKMTMNGNYWKEEWKR